MNSTNANESSPPENSPALIYVVDDEPMLLELAIVILEPEGYSIKTFRDPEIALGEFSSASRRPDLVITDYAMHSMNGMQLIEHCRKLVPAQKILLVSGTVGEDIFSHTPIRPDSFLAKPYQAEQLTSTVRDLLANK